MQTFGQILAKCRKECQLTQKQVVERLFEEHGLRVKVASLSQWEKGQHLPNVKQFFALCLIYEIGEISRVFGIIAKEDPIDRLNEEGQQKVYEYAEILDRSGLYKQQAPQLPPSRQGDRHLPL